MAIQLTTPIIVVIGIASGLVLFLTGSAVVLAILRLRQKHYLIQTNAVNELRLSQYPGGNSSISDAGGIIQLPRARGVLQRPQHANRYHLAGGWTAVDSQDDLPRRPALKGTYKKVTHGNSGMADVPSNPNGPLSWPLPPRLTRSKGSRGSISSSWKTLPLSPVTERSSTVTNSYTGTTARYGIMRAPAVISPRDDATSTDPKIPSLQPKPLFHGQQRSISSGAITDSIHTSTSDWPMPYSRFAQIRVSTIKPTLYRSQSLQSRLSGNAPTERLPSPPPCAHPWSRVQELRDSTKISRRDSQASSMSTGSSILNQEASNPISTTETEYSSLSFMSSLAGKRNIQPGVVSQKSFQASIEQPGLTRSASSGLALSLTDKYGVSRSVSNASCLDTSNQDLYMSSVQPSQTKVLPTKDRIFSSMESLLRDCGNRTTVIDICNKKSNRRSTSILQVTSGNQVSPTFKKRPSSVATSQPFKWDNIQPGRPSAMKARREGHKRQSRQRITFTMPIPPQSSVVPTVEEADELEISSREKCTIPGVLVTEPQNGRSSPRPPSRVTFDPQLKVVTPTMSSTNRDSSYSATMSMYRLYTPERSKSPPSTPTKKPAARRQQISRQKAAPDLHPNNLRHLRPTTPTANTLQTPLTPDSSSSIPVSTILAQFQPPPDWRHPLPNRVLGPRAAPSSRFRSPTRCSKRLSPLRQIPRFSPRRDSGVLSNVVALRRMNSDASEMGWYSKLGDAGDQVFGGVAEEDLFKISPKRNNLFNKGKDEDLSDLAREMMLRARMEIDLGVEGMELSTADSSDGRRVELKASDKPRVPQSPYDGQGFLKV